MKAVIFALIVLLGVDVTVYHAEHLHAIGAALSAAGDEVGSWVYQG